MPSDPVIRVIVVEDQPLFRSMLSDTVRRADGLELLGTAGRIEDARRLVEAEPPDVLLLDVSLPDGNGFAFGRSMRAAHPGVGVVLLSGHDVMELLLALPDDERAGWSYLSKFSSTSHTTLLRALRASARGASMLDPSLLATLRPRKGSPLSSLTPRQLHALRLLAEGLSNAAIAREMGISMHSVENLLNAVYTALGVREQDHLNTRVAAALHLVRHGAIGEDGG